MIIGILKEIKKDEYRVGVTPVGVYEFVQNKHKIYIQSKAGLGSGYSDRLLAVLLPKLIILNIVI